MNTLLSDLCVGLRLLWKDKAFTATAGLTLAGCIGANTARRATKIDPLVALTE